MRKVGAHQRVRVAVQRPGLEHLPVQPLEKRHVLRLHMGEEVVAVEGMGAADGQPDQAAAQLAVLAPVAMHGQPRAPPGAGCRAVDAHGADQLVGLAGQAGQCDEVARRRLVAVDVVAVVADEQRLLLAEHLAAQRIGLAVHPRVAGPLDAELGFRPAVQFAPAVEVFGVKGGHGGSPSQPARAGSSS